MPHSRSVRFESDRFDFQSELPPDANAGNRFYGADVAAFLAEQLTRQGFPATFLDEDWGWLVLSEKGAPVIFEIAIYNLSDHREGNRPGTPVWGLWIRCHESRKILGVIPKRSEVPVSPALLSAVEAAIRISGAQPQPWDDDPP